MKPLTILVISLLSTVAASSSQQLIINPEKRLKAVISFDAMNRLAVVNDRITQVFGDQEAYEIQQEETTGQIFLKPSQENGKKPLSLTIITEAGITQDLSLQPADQSAGTILFKKPPEAPAQGYVAPQVQYPGTIPASYQEELIQALKTIILGKAPELQQEETLTFLAQDKDLTVTFVKSYQLGGFRGWEWKVKNTSDQTITLWEKDFYRQGNLAIALGARTLAPKGETALFVLSR
jgi:conjugal transfer pilus assembly protein TraK